jgi:hypothetical protein
MFLQKVRWEFATNQSLFGIQKIMFKVVWDWLMFDCKKSLVVANHTRTNYRYIYIYIYMYIYMYIYTRILRCIRIILNISLYDIMIYFGRWSYTL